MKYRREFSAINSAYVSELYERYREDPESIDKLSREFFEKFGPPDLVEDSPRSVSDVSDRLPLEKAVGVANLAQAIRNFGHLRAQLDPLGSPPRDDPSLEPSYHGLEQEELARFPASLINLAGETSSADGPMLTRANAAEAIQRLYQIYCSRIGYDYGHLYIPDERTWLRNAAESGRFRPPAAGIDSVTLLERLTQVETFELFLHRTFPGKTRFSIEGLDLMVPMLDEIISHAGKQDICMVFIGMAHRGRLNVLAHVLQKPYDQILAEFKDPGINFTVLDELGWTGDVKYHKGADVAMNGDETVKLVVCMPPNPSHLEHINPVLEGMARAAGSQTDQPGRVKFHEKASIPVLIHGDASFIGQGVVAETLNLSQLPGYYTGGTIHIIANNQLGYTATSWETRGSLYASELAKGYKIPIIHVNADDPVACIESARTAAAYRDKFHKDFLIDLVGYRRYGHNEGDEPSFTQPRMYSLIKEHPSVRELWAKGLVDRGELAGNAPDEIFRGAMDELQYINEGLQAEEALVEPIPEPPPSGAAQQVQTGVPVSLLRELNESLLQVPEGFNINRKLSRSIERRRHLFDETQEREELEDERQPQEESRVDWATAEELAFATILTEGIPIRMTGQDAARGTFSQRHAIFHDIKEDEQHIPLQRLPQARAAFEIRNSPLSESAALGFEFGYDIMAQNQLVIWEAQYGDFVNVAQAMIDEFLVSARAKWGQSPSLVLLLPHGNEGQGPDHSSGRLERFLQLAADINMRIAYPTTAAQYFHLLRRQASLLTRDPLPLVVFTPKGLLRHPKVASQPGDFEKDKWRPVIGDSRAAGEPGRIQKLILCTGRVYIDLIGHPSWGDALDTAIVRVEQLFRFPEDLLRDQMEMFPDLREVVWVQEEPRNMGGWEYMHSRLSELVDGRWRLHYVGRAASSSPGEGSATWYAANQRALIEQAYRTEADVVENGVLVERG
jgi:2-oxoglutarate dehydrogenase E1 component